MAAEGQQNAALPLCPEHVVCLLHHGADLGDVE